MSVRVSIVGGSGYLGGELLRLLLFHGEVALVQVTSRSQAGKPLHNAHPNLRGLTELKFSNPDELQPVDLLFLALGHGEVAADIERYAALAPRIIDCSADFRLRDPQDYPRWYGREHPAPDWLDRFVYGLPERHRTQLAGARYASSVGCNATVLNLALAPLADAGWLDHVVAEVKVGSSEAGGMPNAGSHHPERSGALRVYSPSGHRHLAEVRQELGPVPVYAAITAIEMVRGAQLTARCFPQNSASLDSRDIWRLYRDAYAHEPFIRLLGGKQGLYRFPEPKILSGSNYCDIGFAIDEANGQLVVIAALDNMMKGGAGNAVQAMNVMLGFDERQALGFPGLHPI